jgi:hypothetical protein
VSRNWTCVCTSPYFLIDVALCPMDGRSSEVVHSSDCLSCRVVGCALCFGASSVLVGQLLRGIPPVGGPLHRAALTAFSCGFAVLGVARAMT